MFNRLKEKWGVSIGRLLLILCTFAIGGSLCGLAGRKILELVPLEKNILWYVLYIVLITILWPLCVLLVSIPLGQFAFFRRYLARIGRRITGKGKRSATQYPDNNQQSSKRESSKVLL